MRHEFRVQDPLDPSTVYLIEAIIEASRRADSGRAVFAFASRRGIEALLLDEEFREFIRNHPFQLLVGIDAVTNRQTLERLQEIQQTYRKLEVLVFWNRQQGALFHPKVVSFARAGPQTLIVGSGNLTTGGLKRNYEAFSVVRSGRGTTLDLTAWDRFLEHHKDDIRPIDVEALERASKNVIRSGRRSDIEPEDIEGSDEIAIPTPEARFLIAQITKAGPRWDQAGMNKKVIKVFFRAKVNSSQRVFLTGVVQDGTRNSVEIRPVTRATSNKNPRIELGIIAAKTPYPSTPPVAVFKETQVRAFEYMVLMPGQPGYDQLRWLSENLEQVGKGHLRAICDAAEVRERWAECPLLAPPAKGPPE